MLHVDNTEEVCRDLLVKRDFRIRSTEIANLGMPGDLNAAIRMRAELTSLTSTMETSSALI